MTSIDDMKMVETHDRQERQPITAVWRNGGFSASYDSFVGKQTLVLRINICGRNRHLRQAAKRCRSFFQHQSANARGQLPTFYYV